MKLLEQIQNLRRSGSKAFAVLIDPDKPFHKRLVKHCVEAGATFFLIGGSKAGSGGYIIDIIREHTDTPVLLFPGHPDQFCPSADGILLPCLISGRNPDLLIGYHIRAALQIRDSGMEVISTGYILTGDHTESSVARISSTNPIPYKETDTLISTAIAGEMLGLKTIYLEAGSGAKQPVKPEIIRAVRHHTQAPLFVGGGIRTTSQAKEALDAGADLIVIGNLLETNSDAVNKIAGAVLDHRTELTKP